MEIKVYKKSEANVKVKKAIKLYDKEKYAKAAKIFSKFVNEDPVAAFYYSQYLYDCTKGKRDLDYAITIAERGANMGCAQCIDLLAYIYGFTDNEDYKKEGLYLNEEKAIKLWLSLKDIDYGIGWLHLGQFYAQKMSDLGSFLKKTDKDFAKAEQAYKKAIDKKCKHAYYDLAKLYLNFPVFKKQAKAVEPLLKGQAAGDLKCDYKLGCLYLEGDVVDQDINKGLELIGNAAKKGELLAQLKLAVMYYKGQKVDKDQVQSVNWIIEASDNGFDQSDSQENDIDRAEDFLKDETLADNVDWTTLAFSE